MSLKAWWTWFRTLKQNPIYRREAGLIGEPNPFFSELNDYSLYIISGTMLLGLCAGGSNRIPLMGVSDKLILAWIVLCIPGMIVSMITIYATMMAPAVTAPAINLEIKRGSWDILLLTPQPAGSIAMAKLFGALTRIKIWSTLLFLNAIQILLLILVVALTRDSFLWISLLIGTTAVLRPWLEILFAAFWSMFMGLWFHTTIGALIGSYTGIVIFRIVNSTIVWLGVMTLGNVNETLMINLSAVGPLIIYAGAIPLAGIGIFKKAERYV